MHLRHGVTHNVLACWFAVDRSTHPHPDRPHNPVAGLGTPPARPGQHGRRSPVGIDGIGLAVVLPGFRLGQSASMTVTWFAMRNRATSAPQAPVPSIPTARTSP
ncbi:hypothetical protein [Streptomyces kronopolitis]